MSQLRSRRQAKVVEPEDVTDDDDDVDAPKPEDQRVYLRMKGREHVLHRPDQYIGETKITQPRIVWSQDADGKCSQIETLMSPGMEQVALQELLSNAVDSTTYSVKQGMASSEIEVRMDDEWLSVCNGGFPIAVSIDTNTGMYLPQLVLATMRTSSNYDDNQVRHAGGRNGVGAKCVNIFSKEFLIDIGDAQNNLRYTQRCSQNMSVIDEPKIRNYKHKQSYVLIKFRLDFKRFGMKCYPEEAASIFRRHCFDAAYNSGVKVSFAYGEDEPQVFNIAINDALSHGRGYFDLENMAHIVFYRWPSDSKITHHTTGLESAVSTESRRQKRTPLVRILAVDTPGSGRVIAFANGVYNREGGIHVDAAYDALRPLLEGIKSGKKRVTTTPLRGKKPGEIATITMADIKKHVSLIVSVWTGNPSFASQSKDRLTDCLDRSLLKPNIEPGQLNKMLTWTFADELRASLETKGLRKLNANKSIFDPKHEKANHAGKSRKKAGTVLVLSEGGSASGYVTVLINEGGRDKIGQLPLRGKTLNTIDTDKEKLNRNKEICAIVAALGLQYGVDYSKPENYRKLHYDALMIITDADPDGDHIKGLVVAFLYHYWPSLFDPKVQYVMYWQSPLYRAHKAKKHLSFYDDASFKAWQAKKESGWVVSYSKGLGSNSREDVKRDFHSSHQVSLITDANAAESIQIGFGDAKGKGAQARRDWMQNLKRIRENVSDNPTPIKGINVKEAQEYYSRRISDFIHIDHKQFSLFNVRRALPSAEDGMKVAERKIVYVALEHTNYGRKKLEMEVVSLAGKVKQDGGYHSGDKSLHDNISLLATSYVCQNMNTLPIFTACSLMGDRNKGKDAIPQARYAKVRIPDWLPLIYREEDMKLLDPVYDNGHRVEPAFLLPTFPLHLVNGVKGIGTGWSTEVPNFNPVHILSVLRWKLQRKLNGRSTTTATPTEDDPLAHRADDIQPYYRGFMGEAQVKMNINAKSVLSVSVETRGNYHMDGDNVIITELPVGSVCSDYRVELAKFREAGAVSDVIDQSGDAKIHFELVDVDPSKLTPKEISHKSLRLVDSTSMNNMHFLRRDADDCIQVERYPSAHAILDAFFDLRYPWYEKRHLARTQAYHTELAHLQDRIRFYRAVLSAHFHDKGVVNDEQREMLQYPPLQTMMREEDDIAQDMANYDPPIPYQIYVDTPHRAFSINSLRKLEETLKKVEVQLAAHSEKQPANLWLDDLQELEESLTKLNLL